jgi:hypothetical protein
MILARPQIIPYGLSIIASCLGGEVLPWWRRKFHEKFMMPVRFLMAQPTSPLCALWFRRRLPPAIKTRIKLRPGFALHGIFQGLNSVHIAFNGRQRAAPLFDKACGICFFLLFWRQSAAGATFHRFWQVSGGLEHSRHIHSIIKPIIMLSFLQLGTISEFQEQCSTILGHSKRGATEPKTQNSQKRRRTKTERTLSIEYVNIKGSKPATIKFATSTHSVLSTTNNYGIRE